MARRPIEPEDAFGPAIDGLISFDQMVPAMPEESEIEELDEQVAELPEEDDNEGLDNPVALLFGDGAVAQALASLASGCGFEIHVARLEQDADAENAFPDATVVLALKNLENIVEDCNIERNSFICIFTEDTGDCELILSQCLASDAYYIGMSGDQEKISEVFRVLREDGAPDAELAAVAAPMGLNIGARDSDQLAVAIVAEMLAARAGKLKRLRLNSRKESGRQI